MMTQPVRLTCTRPVRDLLITGTGTSASITIRTNRPVMSLSQLHTLEVRSAPSFRPPALTARSDVGHECIALRRGCCKRKRRTTKLRISMAPFEQHLMAEPNVEIALAPELFQKRKSSSTVTTPGCVFLRQDAQEGLEHRRDPVRSRPFICQHFSVRKKWVEDLTSIRLIYRKALATSRLRLIAQNSASHHRCKKEFGGWHENQGDRATRRTGPPLSLDPGRSRECALSFLGANTNLGGFPEQLHARHGRSRHGDEYLHAAQPCNAIHVESIQ